MKTDTVSPEFSIVHGFQKIKCSGSHGSKMFNAAKAHIHACMQTHSHAAQTYKNSEKGIKKIIRYSAKKITMSFD